eukprot:gene22965-27945_t
MDQIAAMGLKAIAAYKAQLDAAAAQVEVARALARKVELFEVTIGMIPKRGDDGKAKEMRLCVPGVNSDESEEDPKLKEMNAAKAAATANGNTALAKEIANRSAEYIKQQMKAQIINQAKDFISKTPLGEVAGFATYLFGDVDTTAVINKVRPANVLNALKESGAKDLEVSFLAMRFIISAALDIVSEAVGDCEKIEPVQWFWICMPWKVQQQNEVGEALAGHLEAIDKFNAQLQTAISIASYCVSLEQLENVLNATSMLVAVKVGDFWRRKVGISNTRVNMSELSESFWDEMADHLIEYKQKQRFRPESIAKLQASSEVALTRFLSSLWNDNGDKVASVFEVNNATKHYVEKHGKNVDALGMTLQEILEIERDFFSKIKFTALVVSAGPDGKEDTDDDLLVVMDNEAAGEKYGVELHPSDKVISLRPFQCVRVHCQLPYFNPEIFPYDFVALLRYNRSELKDLVSSSAELTLEEVEGSRTYLNTETNVELYGKDIFRWNAPKTFKNHGGKDQIISGFKSSNFYVTLTSKAKEDEDKDQEAGQESKKGLEKADVSSTINLLYVPVIKEPGLYTVRYVLDSLEIEDSQSLRKAHKKMALSQRSYYYNRLLDQSASDDKRSISNFTAECFDEAWDEFRTLMIKILDVEHVEAKVVKRDFATLKRIERDRSKLLKGDSKDSKFQPRPIKFEYLEDKSVHNAAAAPSSPGIDAASDAPPAANNNATNKGEKMSKGDNAVTMMTNPMLAKGRRTSVKKVSSKLDNLYARVAPNLDAEFPATATAFLQSLNDSIQRNLGNRAGMLAIECQLLRMEFYFLGKQLSDRLQGMFAKNTAAWIDSWTNTEVKKNLLVSADNNLRAIKTVQNLIYSLIPDGLHKAASAESQDLGSAVQPKKKGAEDSQEEELRRKVESGYLADPENDRVKDATDILPDNVLLLYLLCKEAVYQVDAKNSIASQNIRRLEMLQDKIVDVFRKETAVVMAINGALVGGKGRSRGSVYYSDAKTAGKIKSGEEANALIQKKRLKDALPADAASLVAEVILEVNKYIDSLLEPSSDPVKRVNYRKDIKAAETCSKIVEELELYAKKLTYLANAKPIAKDDDLALGLKRFKPPLGLVIHVLDENALAWGEKVPKLEDNENSYDEDDGGDTEGKKAAQAVAKSEDEWRPQVDYRYPFTAKGTLNFKKTNYDFDDKTSCNSQDLTFAIFFNVKKVDKKAATDASAPNNAPAELQPAAFLVICKNDGSVVKRFELGKARNAFHVVNFFELISDSTHIKEMDNIQLMIAFEDPANPGTPLNDEVHKDPVLLLNIATATSDDFEYDDDSDEEEDESEDSGDADDDDDDDYDAYDSHYYAETMARQAEEMLEDLPDKTMFDDHEHELIRLGYVYAGDYGCDHCGEQGQGLVYHCPTCNYDAHPQCACGEIFADSFKMKKDAEKMKDELPMSVITPHCHEHPLARYSEDSYYCDHCDSDGQGLVYRCVDCSFHVHPQCVFPEKFDEVVMKEKAAQAKRSELPESIGFEDHRHRLELMSDWEYYCDHCGDDGNGLVYRCAPCNYDVHPQCAVPHIFGLHAHAHTSHGDEDGDDDDDNDNDEGVDGDGEKHDDNDGQDEENGKVGEKDEGEEERRDKDADEDYKHEGKVGEEGEEDEEGEEGEEGEE